MTLTTRKPLENEEKMIRTISRNKARVCSSVVIAAALAVTAACSSSTSTPPAGTTSGSSSTPAITGTVKVLAASSLTKSFTTLKASFETAHPGVTVTLVPGASSSLATQINNGAPADVFASASPKNMQQVVDAGGASTSTNFVSNVMEIAVPPGNPAHITSVADLAKPGVKVAICQAQVPCGAVAAKVFANAKVTVKPVTLEENVTATLTKVSLNEVQAGVVYVTDVLGAGSKVEGVKIPDEINASTKYPIAVLTKAANTAGAQAFVDYVLSPAGQAVLAAAGFQKP